MNDLKNKNLLIDSLGFVTLGAMSLCYVIFYKYFAELHIQLPFLSFPIFVGELCLLFCTILFFIKLKINKQKPHQWLHYVLILYFLFVLIKALFGFIQWGPLALRHSALFYYPAFAIFAYVFYRKELFNRKICILFLVAISAIFAVKNFYGYWTFTLLALGFILINTFSAKIFKFMMALILIVLTPHMELFQTSRMMIISNFVSGVFLAIAFPIIIHIKRSFKITLAVLLGSLLVLGILKYANQHAVRTIVDIRKMSDQFSSQDLRIAELGPYALNERKEVKLYNPDIIGGSKKGNNKSQIITDEQVKGELRLALVRYIKQKIAQFSLSRIESELQEEVLQEVKEEFILVPAKSTSDFILNLPDAADKDKIESNMDGVRSKLKLDIQKKLIEMISVEIEKATIEEVKVEVPNEIITEVKKEAQLVFDQEVSKKIPQVRTYIEEERWSQNQNAIFRLLIWRDMLVELSEKKPVFGFDFGKPLRSVSLEALEWGSSEWARDGWVGAHNSYLHIIYRAGVIGILLIVGFMITLFKMILLSIHQRSIAGILICSIIINWFVAANFLLILELPYTAVPIWILYGIAVAQSYKVQNENPNRT